ncbi:hypothetical protein U472_03555 [Orenia metallireducens]|uniref:Flagellar assembly factor FliW n=1 Tax=Orenia metallireducens TaxID=1413210 RepID=A0A1C0ABC1_9FIRM|nr:flagellar assembly protein FliW [Orenia metallireducens]OCL27638.1 hypothetical protein U472_03555 [Orenia metallireducens]
MKIKTRNFGIIDIEEDKVIEFKKPILGFEDYTKFTIIDSLDDNLFYWLQSLTEPSLAFIMVNPFNFVDNYIINLSEGFQNQLELNSVKDEEIIINTLATVGKSDLSINLKAPIIINAKNKIGGQIILEDDYPSKYYLIKKGLEE